MMFDGASKGNPGIAGAGAVIYDMEKNEIESAMKFVGYKETNNVAEYHGLILGLNLAVKLNIKKLMVCGDSLLVINQMKGDYKVKSEKLQNLYITAKRISTSFDEIVYTHVPRELNKRADDLANTVLFFEDEGENKPNLY